MANNSTTCREKCKAFFSVNITGQIVCQHSVCTYIVSNVHLSNSQSYKMELEKKLQEIQHKVTCPYLSVP